MLRFLSRLFRSKPSLDPVALAALDLRSRTLSRAHVAQAVSRALGRPFPESDVREEDPSYHRLRAEGFEFTAMSSNRPYLPLDDGRGTRDLRLRNIIDRQQAATAIDCWSAPKGVEREAATDLMGRILVELTDDATVGVYAFHTQRVNAADETLRTMLREGRAMKAMSTMTTAPISGVASDDDAMARAIAEARERWPEFAAAFAASPHPGDDFVVKARFGGEEEHIEHLWMTATAVQDGKVTGTVQNDAYTLARPRRGETVTIATGEISDWGYLRDGTPSASLRRRP